jgi:lysine 2,3-aminomutase
MSAVKAPARSIRAASTLPYLLTDHLAGLIDPADADDPIARQFVPDAREDTAASDELPDPIGDAAHSPVPGIVHRYPDRVLLTPVKVCAAYCRFCFRREAVGEEVLDEAALETALNYIRGEPRIWEVILSGGDPLVLSPRRLGAIIRALDAITHVETIRIHTRLPVADPARVTDALVDALRVESPVWTVLHCNHPRELTDEVRAACAALVDAGLPMLGQTVLLRGVNDDAATLETLFRTMIRSRIKPYYLHHADKARGTGHFRTTLAEGRTLMRTLRGDLSGIALPTYVLDIPGGYGKVPAGPCYLSPENGGWTAEDPWGGRHPYRDAE